MKNKEQKITICACHSTDHQIIFLPVEEENTYGDKVVKHKEVYVHIHLAKMPFMTRVRYAFRYIFGFQCRYGAFDEIIITNENYHNFKEVADFFEKPVEAVEVFEEPKEIIE